MIRIAPWVLLATLLGGCAYLTRDAHEYGLTQSVRFQQPPEGAARCFARNAEEHSSALVSEVQIARDGSAEVTVRVKNGVTYATADIRRAGRASTGTIVLMVTTTGSRNDLLDALVEGC